MRLLSHTMVTDHRGRALQCNVSAYHHSAKLVVVEEVGKVTNKLNVTQNEDCHPLLHNPAYAQPVIARSSASVLLLRP